MTQTPAVWILLSQGLAPQVSSALERKADEPFATLRLVTQTPAVWILNFRVRDTIIGRDYRHTATYNEHSSSVDRTGGTLTRRSHSITEHRKDYLARDSLFACLPGDDLLSQGLAPQVSSALEVLTSVFEMGTGGTPPA